MSKYTVSPVEEERQHPIVYQDHIPGTEMTRAPQFQIKTPEGKDLCIVHSRTEAHDLLAHLNR